MSKKRGKIIGIDLGTTNSCVAVMEGGTAKVIPNAEGANTTPSIVSFSEKERLVGIAAKRQAVTNPSNTIYSAKRFIGRNFSEIKEERNSVPYEVKEGKGGAACIQVQGKLLTPEDIAAQVLIKMKKTAEEYLGEAVTEAVITVPAYFNDTQRQATKDAGQIAGLDVKRIIPEPTAAALAYGLDKQSDKKIAVFDLGGGTFDISILELGDGVFEVLSTNGDTHLGGDDFDNVIINWLNDGFAKEQGIQLKDDPTALQRLREEAEKTKIELSGQESRAINIPFISMTQSGPKHLATNLTRSELERLVDHLIEKTRKPCEDALRDANLKASDIDEVILVGGMTRMPAVQARVREIFQKDPHKGVNPDEVVALGAAIQGGVLTGDVKDVLLLDVIPLTLGIETMGGVMTPLVERNTTVPTQKKQIFSTAADNQPAVTIVVLQGERKMAKDNKEIGRFDLTDIPPAPRGRPQIEVSFDVDVDGILKVSATDKATGKEQSIRIDNQGRLSEEEIKQRVAEAEKFQEEDARQKEAVEARNEADSTVFRAEKALETHKEKISAEVAKSVQDDINTLKKALEDNEDVASLQEKTKALSTSMQKIGDSMQQASSSNTSSTQDSQTEEAEAEVVDDKKDN